MEVVAMLSPKDFERERKNLKKKGKELGHIPKYQSAGYMCDEYVCSCGWKSQGYFDGSEYAWDEWVRHVTPYIQETSVRKRARTINNKKAMH